MRRISIIHLLCVLALVAITLPVEAKRVSEEEIEQIRTSQDEILRKLAEAMNHIDQVRQEFQRYKGSLDQGMHLNTRYGSQIETIEAEMRTLQDQFHILSTQFDELIEGKLNPKLVGKAKVENDAYILGLDAYNAGNLKSALQIWREFLKKYPKSTWKTGALYWIGEVHFQTGEYPQAIQAYQQVIEKSPQGPWARRALLKQGISFYKLEEYESALAFFEKTVAEHRRTSEGWRAMDYTQEVKSILAERARVETDANPPTP